MNSEQLLKARAYETEKEKEITPDMNNDYVFPNVFMSTEDTARLSQLQSEIQSYTNATRSEWIMNGMTDAQFAEFEKQLYAYGLEEYLGIFQKYLDAFYAE